MILQDAEPSVIIAATARDFVILTLALLIKTVLLYWSDPSQTRIAPLKKIQLRS